MASQPLQRFRLAHWQALGTVPAELPGATVARGYRLAYGRPPARDPERRACCASSRLQLPSTRLLLAHHGRVDLIGNALGEVLGRVVAVDLVEAGR